MTERSSSGEYGDGTGRRFSADEVSELYAMLAPQLVQEMQRYFQQMMALGAQQASPPPPPANPASPPPAAGYTGGYGSPSGHAYGGAPQEPYVPGASGPGASAPGPSAPGPSAGHGYGPTGGYGANPYPGASAADLFAQFMTAFAPQGGAAPMSGGALPGGMDGSVPGRLMDIMSRAYAEWSSFPTRYLEQLAAIHQGAMTRVAEQMANLPRDGGTPDQQQALANEVQSSLREMAELASREARVAELKIERYAAELRSALDGAELDEPRRYGRTKR